MYIYIYTHIYSVTQHHDKYDHVETTVTDAQIMPLQFYFVTQLFAMGLKGGWSGGGGGQGWVGVGAAIRWGGAAIR